VVRWFSSTALSTSPDRNSKEQGAGCCPVLCRIQFSPYRDGTGESGTLLASASAVSRFLPGKMSAELAFFQAVVPVLSAFFTFLAEKGLLSNARTLAKIVAELDEEIVAASQDQRHWGPAKAFAMAAQKAGV